MQQHAARLSATTAARFNGPISLGDLAQALDHSDEGFALTDPGGNYVYLNRAHLRIYGYETPQELLGRSWRVLYDGEWTRHIETAVLPLLPRDKVWRGRVVGRRRDGSPFPAAVTLTLLPDGKITCNCRDESTHPPAAAPTPHPDPRIFRHLPALLLRPVDMVSATTSFLLAETAEAPAVPRTTLRPVLAELEAAARKAATHIRRFARLARLDDDTSAHPAPWPCQLDAAARQLARDTGRESDLRTDFAPATLLLDYPALECIVMELLANALQASRTGDGVEILGRTRGDSYIMEVRDQGIGFPDGPWPARSGRTIGQENSAGIGLDLVTNILARNGGTIEIASDPDCSTCLRLTLPLALA